MRIIFLGLGFLLVGLGAVGAFLPILPTVPFLLAASLCFAKGSERWYRWLTGTKLYQRHLQDFVESRSMTMGTKLAILLPVSAMLILTMFMVDNLAMRICVSCLLAVKYYYFVFRIKTEPCRKAAAKGVPANKE